MTLTYRFRVEDEFNRYVMEIVLDADSEEQARRFAEAWMFARRTATLTLMEVT